MLYVVAWPTLSEGDDAALRRLRAQYHPTEADLIGPHFTLVFGAPDARRRELQGTLERIEQRPFWFVLDRIVRFDCRPPDRSAYLYAVPAEGSAELAALHDLLNPDCSDEPFEPHVTLGLFPRAVEAEQVARIVERSLLPMHGRIEEICLVRLEGAELETVAQVQLRR